MVKQTIHISNHYFCQKCHSNEHIMKYFKMVNNKWLECSDQEAEIGMEYCGNCNCDQRVHESYFLTQNGKINKRYSKLEGKRPHVYIFWKKVKDGWRGFEMSENNRLYAEIY